MKLSTVLTSALAATVAVAKSDTNSGASKYIVVFEKGLETPQRIVEAAENKLKEWGAFITHEYDTVLKGFAVSAPSSIMDKFKSDPTVKDQQYPFIVEEDQVVTADEEPDLA